MLTPAGALGGVLRMMPDDRESDVHIPSLAWLLGQALVLVGLAIDRGGRGPRLCEREPLCGGLSETVRHPSFGVQTAALITP
jgi:hypothetical protein